MKREPLELIFTIQNSTISSKICNLFGANFFLAPLPVGLTIVPAFNVLYTQVLRDSTRYPFTVGKIKMLCSNNLEQVSQNITIVSQNIYGETRTVPNSMNDVSEYQVQAGINESDQEFDITGNVGFSFNVLPNTILVCIVSIKKIIRMPTRFDSKLTREYPIITNY